MEIEQLTLLECEKADDAVVVIDVCRAFTTAAFAFSVGADQIILVSSIPEALQLRRSIPGSLLIGEVDGLPVPEFDLWNSPAQVAALDLSSTTLILRTSAGTRGMVQSVNAKILLAGSFVVARATAELLHCLSPHKVSLIMSGVGPQSLGEEDVACADYLCCLLKGDQVPVGPYLERSRHWNARHITQEPDMLTRLQQDLEYCLLVDHFSFAMQVFRENGNLVLRKIFPEAVEGQL